jgi:hypothetical protein
MSKEHYLLMCNNPGYQDIVSGEVDVKNKVKKKTKKYIKIIAWSLSWLFWR